MGSIVQDLILKTEIPDIALIWIGHNNMDWQADEVIFGEEYNHQMHSEILVKNYLENVMRLRDRGIKKIVCFGLINFSSFFKARNEASLVQKKDRRRFRHFSKPTDIFISLRPEFQDNVVTLASAFNHLLEIEIEKLNFQEIIYSDCFSKMDIDVPTLHESDAWHFSNYGMSRLAKEVSKVLV
jgi:hypothetical protein